MRINSFIQVQRVCHDVSEAGGSMDESVFQSTKLDDNASGRNASDTQQL